MFINNKNNLNLLKIIVDEYWNLDSEILDMEEYKFKKLNELNKKLDIKNIHMK